MPVIILTEYDTKYYGVKFENEDLLKVQKFKNIYDTKNNILCVKPLERFFGKCDVSDMLTRAGVLDNLLVNANTILANVGEENNKHIYIYIYVGAGKIYFFHN